MIYGTAWKKKATAGLVSSAIKSGFRAIDTACQPKHYFEPGVGAGIAASGLPRNELFIQTKFTPLSGQDTAQPLPYDATAPIRDQVRQSCATSLANLRTDYLDSVLIHSPLSTHAKTMEAWRALEDLVGEGKVRQIGVANIYSLPDLSRLYGEAKIKPSAVQNRFYADTGFDTELRAFCATHGIAYQSFWTLTANPNLLASPLVARVALERRGTPEQALFALALGLGITPLTGTSSEAHMAEDLAVLAWPTLDDATFAEFSALLQQESRSRGAR
jgi:diketogulonate reductase-like aldo/keto reductase